MTDPTNAIAYGNDPFGIVGTNVPKKTSEKSGFTTKKFMKKQVAITAIKSAKKLYE
jgi:hypothetical protein